MLPQGGGGMPLPQTWRPLTWDRKLNSWSRSTVWGPLEIGGGSLELICELIRSANFVSLSSSSSASLKRNGKFLIGFLFVTHVLSKSGSPTNE